MLHQVLVGPYHRVRSTKRGGRARPSSAGSPCVKREIPVKINFKMDAGKVSV